MASGGGLKREVGTCLAWAGGAHVRGRAVVEGNAASLCGGVSSLHGGCVTSIARGCGSLASLLACANLSEMQSGLGGASRMASCRDDVGGGDCCVDESAKLGQGWVLSSSCDGVPPYTRRGCDDAIAACLGFLHVSGLALPLLMDGRWCRSRWCDVWRNPSQQRVAPVTMAWGGRQCALADAPSPFLCP